MEEYTITNDPEPAKSLPVPFIESIWSGKGGIIRIEEGALPSKILWELKQLLRSIAIGFQWGSVKKLKAKGMHGEYAEAHITSMLNKLVTTEVPPIPSEVELAGIRARAEALREKQDGEDRFDDTVSQ